MKYARALSFCLVILFLVLAWASPEVVKSGEKELLFPGLDNIYPLSGTREGPWFVNATQRAGLAGVSGNFFAWGDYDDDGYQDLLAESRLFRNGGPPNWRFRETTTSAGLSGGGHGTWADYDNDGLLDLYMTGSNKLWHNEGPDQSGDFTFSDATAVSRIESYSHTTACAWGDYDDDGFVDLYIARGENWNDGNSLYYANQLYRNNGDGTFSNTTLEAGVDESDHKSYSRGVIWGDYNNDGWLDLYVANYRQQLNYLYQNNGNGTFTDVAAEKNVADAPSRTGENPDPYDRPGHGVGALWGDYDNDGDLDLWVTNLNHKDWRTSDDSLLYRNNGAPDYTFTNVRNSAGIPVKPYVAPNQGDELFVGCAWEDLNSDGHLDIYLPQVYGDVGYAYSFLYVGNGDGTFTDVTEAAGVRVWDTYAASWCDYNNDGMPDLLTAGKYPFENGTYEVRLFENNLAHDNNWIKVNLEGTAHNSHGIGARVKVTAGGNTYMREVEGGMGAHGQQNSFPLDFGLGAHGETVDITVEWGPGKSSMVRNVEVNREITVTEPFDTPDIAITELSLSDDHPIAGSIVEFDITVKNLGMTLITNASLKVYLDEMEDHSLIIPPITIKNLSSMEEITHSGGLDTGGMQDLHYIKAEIRDVAPPEEMQENNLAVAEIFIRTSNELPRAVLILSTTEALVGEKINADGSGSTDDVRITEYLFDFGDGTNSGWIQEPTTTHTYDEPGDYGVTLQVMDSDGAVSRDEERKKIVITYPTNENPSAVIESVSPSPARQDEDTVRFVGTGTDQDGQISGYNWRSSVDGTLSDLGDFTMDASEMSTGDHIIFFRVTDDEGAVSPEVHILLTIIGPNGVPVARIDEISPSPSENGEDVYFRGSGDDVDGKIVGYRWYSDIKGLLSQEPEFTLALASGVHKITFMVTDELGLESAPAERSHLVKQPNVAPTCYIDSIEPEFPVEGEPLVLKAKGEDPDGAIAEFNWRSALDGDLGSGEILVVESGLSYGNHTIYLTAVDDDGMSSAEFSLKLFVTWSDIEPSLSLLEYKDGEVSVDARLTFSMEDDFRRPVRIEVKIDNGRWKTMTGDRIGWVKLDDKHQKCTLKVDVMKLENGGHSIVVRGFDGMTYTRRLTVRISVNHQASSANVAAEDELDIRPFIGGAALLFIFVVVSLVLYVKRLVRSRRIMRELLRENGRK